MELLVLFPPELSPPGFELSVAPPPPPHPPTRRAVTMPTNHGAVRMTDLPEFDRAPRRSHERIVTAERGIAWSAAAAIGKLEFPWVSSTCQQYGSGPGR